MENMLEFTQWLKEGNFSQEEIGDWLDVSNKLHNKTVGFYQVLAQWCLVAAKITAEKEEKRA